MFTTIGFWAIFIVFFTIYVLLRHASKWGMMLYTVLFSLGIYAYSSHLLMLTLPAVALFTWLSARRMQRLEGPKRKQLMGLTVVVILLPLLVLKYTGFFLSIWGQLVQTNFSFSALAVPAGISFFTFQAISYVVDVYKGRFTDRVSMLEFFFYLTFFPLIFAGPITRAEHFFTHFRPAAFYRRGRVRPISSGLLYMGLWLIMLGLVKKLVVADYIAQYNDWIFSDPTAFSGLEVLMGVVGYAVQIYCDFSGYSDMSLGLAALLGVALPPNFNSPYRALSIADFWHRWHISLSTWFRDYLYIPLGGNRRGQARTLLNNFLTMIVAGIWHGSTLMFLLWGALHGAALVVQKALRPLLSRVSFGRYLHPLYWFLTFTFVCAAWVPFRASDLSTSGLIFAQIFGHFDLAYLPPFLAARPLWFALVVGVLLCQCISEHSQRYLAKWYALAPWVVKVCLMALVVQLCLQMHTSSVSPFIYYQF